MALVAFPSGVCHNKCARVVKKGHLDILNVVFTLQATVAAWDKAFRVFSEGLLELGMIITETKRRLLGKSLNGFDCMLMPSMSDCFPFRKFTMRGFKFTDDY